MSVTDEAIEQIKSMIVSGELAPGAKLPKEDELAARLGLSRSSLREAVRALAFVRVLDVRQGDGTYVTSLRPELLLEAVSFVVDFHQDDSVLHFLQVRRIVEPAATALAARHAGDEAIAQLEGFLDPAVLELPPHEFVERDRLFHRGVVNECGNPVLVSLLDSISGPIHRARVWRGVTVPTAPERTLREHAAILDALRRRDADVAAARALTHIAGVEDWLRRAIPLSSGAEALRSAADRRLARASRAAAGGAPAPPSARPALRAARLAP
ncbi:MAG TPA: FCD domain-containing protein [Acidimicrobiales bacterium]|nr:FCD domain-containing protein [Acidimicrobiales bacterium]